MKSKINPVFRRQKHDVNVGYSSFPMDNLLNMTSCCGYLIPVYWDFLDPGDKVKLRTILRTKTQPLTSPAMATVIERLEWFAVPIDQLFKPFSAKFYGINDISSDLLEISQYNDYLPYINLTTLNNEIYGLPTTFDAQSAIPSFVPLQAEAMRLCECLGITKHCGRDADYVFPASVSALPFAAYQKIYFDHYRLTDREANDPQSYNLDSFTGTGQSTSDVSSNQSRLRKLITLRKRPYMRDYFTSMEVSPLFGSADINSVGNDLTNINQWLSGLSSVRTAVPTANSAYNNGTGVTDTNLSKPSTVTIPQASSANSAFFSQIGTDNLRSLFAVEKLLRVTRSARKHYDMQTLAHFGVDVPKGLSGECFKLGTHEQYLQIGEVVGTATTADSSLGELAGRGYSEGSGNGIDFEAKCHCVLMCIYSVEPIVNIMSDGIDRLISMVSVNDFFKSEFDSLGLQPVFQKELFAKGYVGSDAGNNTYNVVIGWQPRYMQLKGKYNRSICGCSSTFFQEWALNRTPINPARSGLSNNFFYVWPTDLDNIVELKYEGIQDKTHIYQRDPFINQIYFDVQKASKKSIYGTPKL